MDLRDRFAARFAAALVETAADPADLARRAYDLAEAMLAERARRIDADEGDAIATDARRAPPAPPVPGHQGPLLDEPAPLFEPELGDEDELDPSWLEPPYDPSWDLEARWSGEPAREEASSRPPGPGLARARPDDDDARRERSA